MSGSIHSMSPSYNLFTTHKMSEEEAVGSFMNIAE